MVRLALLAWLLATSLAAAQPTFEIDLNSSRSGVIPAEETGHLYALNVPAGVAQLTIRVDAFGDKADIAVYYGDQEEELFYYSALIPGISSAFTLNNPRAGRYEIHVINPLWQPLSYELHVTADGGQVMPPDPGMPSLTIAARTVSPEQQFEVSFSGAPGNNLDWIGLYPEGADDHAYLGWLYIEGLRSGSRTFTAPVEPGRYNFRLFENNSYRRLAVSETFEVRASGAGTQADTEILTGTWQHVANIHFRGTLTFSRTPDGWQGTQFGRALQDIQFDGSVLRFVVPIGAQTQRYVGRLSISGGVARFSGTFTQADTGAREYPWTAERPY